MLYGVNMLVYAFGLCSISFIIGGGAFLSAGVSATGFSVSLQEYAGLFLLVCFGVKNATEIGGKNWKRL